MPTLDNSKDMLRQNARDLLCCCDIYSFFLDRRKDAGSNLGTSFVHVTKHAAMSWPRNNKKRKASGGSSVEVPRMRVKRDDKHIADFVGRFSFLSNGYVCQFGVRYKERVFPSVEHALQAAKTDDVDLIRQIKKAPTAVDAKRIGNKIKVDRKAWKVQSKEVMERLLRDKFKRNKSLAQALVETRGKTLVYDNEWNDTFWGVSKGRGFNHLGQMLEDTRTELITAHDAGLGKWVKEQFDLCTREEANVTALTLQAHRDGEPCDDPLIILKQGQFYTFGKSSGCDVTLRHPSISRMHAALMILDDGLIHCIDFRSSHYTRVNGKTLRPLEPKLLRQGDMLRFGASSCSYKLLNVEKGSVDRSQTDLYASVMTSQEKEKEEAGRDTSQALRGARKKGSDFSDGCTIFVGSVPEDASESLLRDHFKASGNVVRVHLPLDSSTRAPRGIAFVTFTTYQEALKAQQLDGSTLRQEDLKTLSVRLAKPSSKSKGDDRGGRRPADWTCPNCKANVFASKSACYRCNEPRPGHATTGVNSTPVGSHRKY